MGLFIKQDETRSQLQTKIAADLAERLNKSQLETSKPLPPSAYLDNQHKSSSLLWLWILLAIFVAIAVVWFLFFSK